MPDDRSDEHSVINLEGHLAFRPDIGELARRRVASAQQRLAITTEEFARQLDDMVDWDVSPEVLERWTTSHTPPGDVLIAADLLVQRGSRSDGDSLGTTGADVLQDLIAERFSDVAAVYASRAAFLSAVPPHVLFEGVDDITIAGLSLNLVCQQYPDQRMVALIEGGCAMRCLFLAPYGTSIQAREHEEDYPPGQLSMLTEMNIQILTRLRSRLSDEAQPRLRLRTYDEPIRFNIVLVDRRFAAVQPYMPAVRGVDSPTFVLRQVQGGHGLLPAFERVLTWLWDRGKPIN